MYKQSMLDCLLFMDPSGFDPKDITRSMTIFANFICLSETGGEEKFLSRSINTDNRLS